MVMEGKAGVVFGKKRKGSHIRLRKFDSGEDEEETTDDIAAKLEEVKNEQMFRKRHKGLDVETMLTAQNGSRVSSGAEVPSQSIKQMMGTQFAVVQNSSSGGTVTHENLLEKYVEEKLGKDRTSEVAEKVLTEEDRLYLVPEEIKALEGRGATSAGPGGDDAALTWTTGIAEVALPIDFKLKNIEATEAARKKEVEDRQAQRELRRIVQNQKTLCLGNTTAALMRKQQQDKWKSEHVTKGSSDVSSAPIGVARQGVTVSSVVTSASDRPPAGYEKSSDDIAVGKFLKSQKRLNR